MTVDNKLIQECKNDFNRCFKDLKVSNTWINTGSQNLNYFENSNLESLVINSNFKGLFHIDHYPSTSFINKSNIIDLYNLQRLEKLTFYKKIYLYKKNISPSYVINYRNFLNIKKLINKKSNILEIGGGLGILSSMIYRSFSTKNFLCDIPSTLILQKYYIKKNFPKSKSQFIANFDDKIEYDNDFFFINSSQLSRLDLDLDLIINIDSFSEMDKITIDQYLKYAEKKLKKNGYVYLSNTIGHSTKGYNFPSDINLPKKFIIKDVDIFYPTARDNYSKYLNVILEKKTTQNIRPSKKKLLQFYSNSDFFASDNFYNFFKTRLLNDYNLNKIYKEYQKKNNSKSFKIGQIDNVERLFIFFLKKTIKILENKRDKKKLILNLCEELKSNHLRNDISIISKLILLYSIIFKRIDKKYLDLVNENSFESVFLKFNLSNNAELKNICVNKLIKFKNLHYFEILKVYYCATIVKNIFVKRKYKKIILKKAKNKLLILYFLKLLLSLGDIKEFISQYHYFIKKKKIYPSDISNEIISINTLSKNYTINIFKLIKNKINFSNLLNNSDLDIKILELKTLFLKEEEFLKFVRINYWNDYYKLGYILKNTLNFLKKKNINLIANRSLSLNNSLINLFFIADVYFFNFMKKKSLDVYSKIYNIENLNIYHHLKKIIAKKLNNLEIRNLIHSNFFKVFNSGNLTFMPIFNSANNQIRYINKFFFL